MTILIVSENNMNVYGSVYTENNIIYGCDNNNFCSYIIFNEMSNKEEENDSYIKDPIWYIKFDLNSNEFFDVKLHILDDYISSPQLSLIKFNNDKIKINLNKVRDDNIEYFSARLSGITISDIKSFVLIYDDKYFSNNIEFNEKFKSNNDEKKIVNNDIIYAHKWYNEKLLSKDETKQLLNKYSKDSNESCIDNDNNFSFKIDNIGEFVVLCSDIGYNYSVTLWKKLNGKLEPYDFENDISDLGLDGFVGNNNINGFSLAQDDPYKFYVIVKERQTGDCGAIFTFVFDGERFRLVREEDMPVCANIYDWIKVYDVPFKKMPKILK